MRSLTKAGVMTMALAALHHAYGATAFATPWRFHVVPIAIGAAAALILLARFRMRWAKALLVGAVLLIAVGWIGLFEGLYNHALRLLVYGVADAGLYATLYASPAYAAPTDWFFELTGVAQSAPALRALALIVRRWRGSAW